MKKIKMHSDNNNSVNKDKNRKNHIKSINNKIN
jgi:hypothetical protein